MPSIDSSLPEGYGPRTVAEIRERYETNRSEILERIAKGIVSASMSEIEYYPKPWDELDMNRATDRETIAHFLCYDPATQTRVAPWSGFD